MKYLESNKTIKQSIYPVLYDVLGKMRVTMVVGGGK